MGIDDITRLWLAALAGGAELTILKPDIDAGASPMLACVPGATGDQVCVECFIDDASGRILFDLGLEYEEFEAGQAGERPTGAELDARSTPVKLNLTSAATQEAAEAGKRRASDLDHSSHRTAPRLNAANGRYGLWCEDCQTWAIEDAPEVAGFLRNWAQQTTKEE